MNKNKIFGSIIFLLIISISYSAFAISEIKLSSQNNQENNIDSIMINVFFLYKQKAYRLGEMIFLTDTMTLSVGQKCSVFYDFNKQKRDSIDGTNLATNPVYRNVELRVDDEALQSRLERNVSVYHLSDASKGESAKIFKHRQEQKITTIDEFAETFYRLEEQPLSFNWEITDDTLTVLNYTCLKAITKFRGREYSAWFTVDIPINDGPWKLYGLPGMILKVEDSEKTFSFEAFGINHVKNQFIEMGKYNNIIDCENYNQLQNVRDEKNKRVFYGYIENGNMVYYKAKNPIEFIKLEK